MLATHKLIDTAKTPFFPSLIDMVDSWVCTVKDSEASFGSNCTALLLQHQGNEEEKTKQELALQYIYFV
jgi:hypothetical protein